ncbi:MAG: hypothetical protein ACI84R_001509 [Candidatus Azotimanducaceae bacterium]|jgi:uncharacterized protein with ParB-like and HNH nuclease domain
MIPEKLTIQELFSRERRFVIPLFQRAYVWNKEEQWEPLWEDIERRAEAHFKKMKSDTEGKVRSHFMGAVVLSNSVAQGRSIARCDVIDGQQRLTTLQLLLAALRDQAKELGAEEEDVNIFRDLTRNPRRAEDSEELFKVWPTNSDQGAFVKVMTAGSISELQAKFGPETLIFPRMAQAYFYFADEIATYVQQDEESSILPDRFLSLVSALKESLQLVVIELEAEDDPQIIFETLNARGQALLPSDLIRNFIFMKVGGEKSDALYDQHWRHFDDLRVEDADQDGETRFWHLDERQGRLTRPRIDLFVFHYLTMKTENDIRIGDLFREFKKWLEDSQLDEIGLLKDMKVHSDHFQRLIDPKGNNRIAVFANRLKSLDTATLHPLLLFLLSIEGQGISAEELEECIVDLESFMVRRFICDLTPKNYNRFFLSVLTKAKKAHKDASSIHVAIHDELTKSNLDTNLWPDDKKFKKGWMEKQLYVRSRPDRSAMILKALQSGMRTSRNEALELIETLTVEHLLPQKATLKDYPFAEVELEDDYSPEDYRADLLNTVGNLTLLTGPLNSSVSNGPFVQKIVAIREDSDLRLNAWLRKPEANYWNEVTIEERSKQLFKLAKKIWPSP